jgi:heptosyltransferase-2
LVIAPQWIGDAVMTEPLLRCLAARGERVVVGALPWVAPVYRAMPQVAQVLELPFAHGGLQWSARRAMARQLRGQFDVAYVCPNSFKSALLPWWADIPKRVGYLGEARFGVLTHRVPNPPSGHRPPMVAFYSALASALQPTNASPPPESVPQISLTPERCAAVLAPLGLQQRGYVVLSPGAEYGPAKRWPAAHFAALARQLPMPVVLLGSTKERALCAEIAQAANAGRAGPCLDLSGRTALDEALALVAQAHALVSNDSGLMHVAAAFGTRQVALFGSSSPLHTPPLSPQATVIWLRDDPAYTPPLDCAPCFARTCPLGHTRCLADIAPERVLALLSRPDKKKPPCGGFVKVPEGTSLDSVRANHLGDSPIGGGTVTAVSGL